MSMINRQISVFPKWDKSASIPVVEADERKTATRLFPKGVIVVALSPMFPPINFCQMIFPVLSVLMIQPSADENPGIF